MRKSHLLLATSAFALACGGRMGSLSESDPSMTDAPAAAGAAGEYAASAGGRSAAAAGGSATGGAATTDPAAPVIAAYRACIEGALKPPACEKVTHAFTGPLPKEGEEGVLTRNFKSTATGCNGTFTLPAGTLNAGIVNLTIETSIDSNGEWSGREPEISPFRTEPIEAQIASQHARNVYLSATLPCTDYIHTNADKLFPKP